MEGFEEITKKIKILKGALEILKSEYKKTDFHKLKEANPHESIPPRPEDEEIFKLLTAIQQLDLYIKKLQDEQFKVLKGNETE
jgi:hypothetical protein